MLFDMSHLLQGMMSIAHPLQPTKKRKPANKINKLRQACLRWFTTEKTVITNQPGTEGHTGVVTHGSLPTSLKLTDTQPQPAKLLLEAIIAKNSITTPVINQLKADTNFKNVPLSHILPAINCMMLSADKSTVKVELTEPGEPMEAQLFHPTNHYGILSYPGNAQSIISSALENKHVDINDQSFIDLIKKHGFNKSKAKR